jgi:hypothetical protein
MRKLLAVLLPFAFPLSAQMPYIESLEVRRGGR